MNSHIDSLHKLAAGMGNSNRKQQSMQELPASVDLQLSPEKYYKQDNWIPVKLPYAALGPGIRYQDASGIGHTFIDARTGAKYHYDQWNTPIDTGNVALSQLLTNRTKGSPYYSTTVADVINKQVQDPQYVAKYRQHLNRQAQRRDNKPLLHGFWPYQQAGFDKVMSTPLSRLIRFDKQLSGNAYYYPRQGLIHLPAFGGTSYGITGGKPALSTKPRTSNQAVHSATHIPADLGETVVHQVNHYIHRPNGSAAGAYADTSSPNIDPYSVHQAQQLQMNAAYTRGKYALIQKLRNNPDDPAFRQFDKQKLKYITTFPQFISTDIPGLLQFRRQMRFWRQNPQLAQMLGNQAARTVGSYTQLLNAWEQYKKQGKPVPDAVKKAIRRFQDNSYLGDARRRQYQSQMRNVQRIQYA